MPSHNVDRYLESADVFEVVKKDQSELTNKPWIFASDSVDPVNKKIDKNGKKIGDILDIGQGMQTGRNNVFGKRSFNEIEEWSLNKSQYFKRATNSDIQRYLINDRREFLLYLEETPKLKDLPEGVQHHLAAHMTELKERVCIQKRKLRMVEIYLAFA